MSDAHKITRQRSPNFPAYSLPKCLELAKRFYTTHKRNAVPYEIAIKTLGYSVTSSGGLQVVGALNAYGLIIVDGLGVSKKLRLSDSAYSILEDTRTVSPARDKAIRDAALMPNMFIKVLDEYPDELPSDEHLAYELKFKHGFNPNSVPDFIRTITATFDYAKIYRTDIVHDETADYQRQETIAEEDNIMTSSLASKSTLTSANLTPAHRSPPPPAVVGHGREIAKFIVGQGKTISLVADGDITQKSIQKLIKMLEMNVEDFPVTDESTETH